MEKLYTVKDVALMTGLTERTIRNYIKDGRLKGKKIGVQWRFSEDDINNLFEDENVSNKITESNHSKVLEFIKGEVEPNTGAVVLNIPVTGKEELEGKLQRVIQLINENVNLKFSYQYFEKVGIAQFILIGNIKLLQEFMKERGICDE
ncbi:MAG: helix-turn-helix domain-containing protein [Tissierellia bacterium]|nr:helix-turn-helix domain-containing protein [Tissierellia bacterium]